MDASARAAWINVASLAIVFFLGPCCCADYCGVASCSGVASEVLLRAGWTWQGRQPVNAKMSYECFLSSSGAVTLILALLVGVASSPHGSLSLGGSGWPKPRAPVSLLSRFASVRCGRKGWKSSTSLSGLVTRDRKETLSETEFINSIAIRIHIHGVIVGFVAIQLSCSLWYILVLSPVRTQALQSMFSVGMYMCMPSTAHMLESFLFSTGLVAAVRQEDGGRVD